MMPTRQIESHSGVMTSNEMMAANPHSPALVKTIDMPKGYIDAMHEHTWHQVIFPIKGLLQTQTDHYQHLVPHTSALFVPAGIQHESIALSHTTFVGIYLNPAFGTEYQHQVRTITLTPFLNELLQEIRRQCEGVVSDGEVSRLFAKEFNTSFQLWRQQIRLIYSLSLLDEELSIQSIADQVGYQNDSSYIKAFKAYFDVTPQQFRVTGRRR
ncbi:helix-turn-helix transcriptional regulator [Vibrio vulnificus]|nr:helix-turn-helix transcriptional regulator [Vibrio vulnificus]MCU8302671.1 helix-turn-helix transcriptional regulator [Vibrio vulnificus]HAS8336937.1 AraC family transcriptional regulator [Vibrio vulnificus]HAS8494159.1 AraC family transcriptional regulator [Vibrio vulnificus]